VIAESLSTYRNSANDDFAIRTTATGLLGRNIGYLAQELVEDDNRWNHPAAVDGVLVESVRAAAAPMSFDVEGVLVWIDDSAQADRGDPLLGSFSLTPDGRRVGTRSGLATRLPAWGSRSRSSKFRGDGERSSDGSSNFTIHPPEVEPKSRVRDAG